jgi:hypothetical protein
MVVAYILGTMLMGGTGVSLSPDEARRAGFALIVVAVIDALVLSFLILRSPWRGLRLIGAVFLIHLGVETIMTQIETFYFNSALQLSTGELLGLVAGGGVRALIFAPLAVVILGRLRKSKAAEATMTATLPAEWAPCFAALALVYVVIYFAFGYFVAWQWEATRLYYTGTTSIKPLLVHFRDLFIREDPGVLPFQLLRGALWTALAATIVGTIRARRWESMLAVALTFTAFVALPLGLFPNPYMPEMVRRAHFYELASSMLLFGGIAGWFLHPNAREAVSDLGGYPTRLEVS